ncbi:MAG TPA: hypothetical protein VFP20_06190 [Bacteroidales bacterium]|nr:hypothetical protein [Bacteroidales bacterium]
MKPEDITKWINDPSQLNRESMLQLKSVMEEYPCFTIVRMLYLKSLLNLNDLHFSASLIRTAISAPDRRRLYYFIEGKNLPERLENPKAAPLESGGFSLIDRFLQGSTPTMAPVPEEAETFSGALLNDSQDNDVPLKQSAPKPEGEFVLNYAEFLSMQPENIPVESVQPMNGQELIDQFLMSSANNDAKIRLKPDAEKVGEEVSIEEVAALEQMVSSFNLPEDSFTDTLAKIYLKQKRYDRALEIFKGLSLKYPEKNVYFADQIRFLEKLIIHIKK